MINTKLQHKKSINFREEVVWVGVRSQKKTEMSPDLFLIIEFPANSEIVVHSVGDNSHSRVHRVANQFVQVFYRIHVCRIRFIVVNRVGAAIAMNILQLLVPVWVIRAVDADIVLVRRSLSHVTCM